MMRDYSQWMTRSDNSEDLVYGMAEKSQVNINNSLSTFETIINDANEWQKDVDLIWLIKKSLFTPSMGDYIEYKNQFYLNVYMPEERETYWSSKARLCNSLFPIQSNKTRVLMRDVNGNVLYDDLTGEALTTETSESTTIPCIVENKYRVNDNNDQMWLPENEIMVTLPYRSELKVGYKFEMYTDKYEVVNIDWTKVLNGKGILTLRAKKEVGS